MRRLKPDFREDTITHANEGQRTKRLHEVFKHATTLGYRCNVIDGQRLLPLDASWAEGLAKVRWPTMSLPEVMGGGDGTLRALIREYLFISLFRACAESLASENASRLAAMQRADNNIDKLLEDLDGTFHRLRQSGTDEELFDVIYGFGALTVPQQARVQPQKLKGSV